MVRTKRIGFLSGFCNLVLAYVVVGLHNQFLDFAISRRTVPAHSPAISLPDSLATLPTMTELTSAKDICVFPTTLLLENPAVEAAPDTGWWLLHTRPRQEKSVARDLMVRGIGFYLPLTPRRTKIRGRLRTSLVPVFSSYLFLHGSLEDRLVALQTQRLVTTFPVKDERPFFEDLQRIAKLIAAGTELTPEARLEPGQRVRVKSGPLIDLEGTLIKRHGRNRLVVWIEQLLKGASVELEDCVVQAI